MNVSSHITSLLVADAANTAISVNSCPSCNPNSTRTALGILWSCLSVLFTCTWVSIHPNVPGSNEGPARRVWTKIKLMILALIAPELLVMWAVRQWYAARRLTNEFKGWTTTHAFFALMGGFALYKGNKHVTVLRYNPPGKSNRREILDNFNESPISCSYPGSGYAAILPISDAAMAEANFDDCSFTAHANFIRRVRKHELEDRNKSDSFAKLIAVGQTAWFVVQLCARWATNLPVTELEIMTLAFAVMNVAIYLFWWNKPLGVGFPIRIQRDAPDQSVLEDPDEDPDDQSILSPRGRTKWAGIQHSCSLFFQQVIQEFKDMLGIDNSFTEMGLCKKLLWVLITNPLRLLVAPANAILQAVLADGLTVTEGPPEKVASFERTVDLEPKNGADKLMAYGAATIFGAIHCIAWTSQFPSEQEKILWRVCSLLVACIPIYMAFCNVVEALESVDDTSWWFSSLAILYVVAILLYIFARLSLLVQGFLALRALPPAALEAVQWTNFLPHI